MRRHHGLRARSARCCRDHIWPRGSGRHDRLGLAGRRHVDRGRLGDLRGRCVTGDSPARVDAFAEAAGATAFRSGLASAFGLAAGTISRARPRSGAGDAGGVGARPPATGGSIDACCVGPATELTAGLRGCDGCRNEHDAQLGHLNASFLPGEAQARKPKSLATEGQAQQQSVKSAARAAAKKPFAIAQSSCAGSAAACARRLEEIAWLAD